MRTAFSAFVLASLVVTTGILGPALGGDSRNQVTGTQSLGWRDDFGNATQVGSYSGVLFSGSDVRLSAAPGNQLVRQGLMVPRGPGWDSAEVGAPTVILDQGTYRMWYFGGSGGSTWAIGYATSPDGQTWTKRGVVLSPSRPEEGSAVAYPEVLKVAGEYKMWYSASSGAHYRILYANSTDGVAWTKHGIVVDVGPPGSGEDLNVYSPTVVFEAGTYRMWYSGQPSASPRVWTFLATSADGLAWTKLGVVLSPGPPGSYDSTAAYDASVRLVGSWYEMVYGGVSPIPCRLMYARSTDGVNWTKVGLILDGLDPDESGMDSPTLLVESDGSWKVYYHARGTALQIYLATRPNPTGWLRSVPIGVPGGMTWSEFVLTANVPLNTSLTVTVLDAASLAPVAGLENLTASTEGLSQVSSADHPWTVLEARLRSDGAFTPVLDAWEVRWEDVEPPVSMPMADAGPDRTVRVGTTVAFDGSGSTDNVGIVNYTWSFNDGGARYRYVATWSYQLANVGTYTITLTVKDAGGNSDVDMLVITVTPPPDTQAPVADAGPGQNIVVGATVVLDGSGSTDDVGVVNYTWTFDDGGAKSRHVVMFAYRFANVGTYTITLTVRDAAGGSDSDTVVVVVSPALSVGDPSVVLYIAVLAILVAAAVAAILILAWKRRSRRDNEAIVPPGPGHHPPGP